MMQKEGELKVKDALNSKDEDPEKGQEIDINIKTENMELNNEEEINESNKIFVIINKTTEKLLESQKKSDLIQCALEYNDYLIENLIKEKNNITSIEYNSALNRLYQNLNVLSNNFESFEEKYKLISNKDDNIDNKNKTETKVINKNIEECNDNERLYSNSITNIGVELPL